MDRCRQRKAFTIVEMVIVIAVIAILAAAMIPAISGVIRQANISADKQFAASLNIQLAMESVDREILNESDLRDVINKYYGAEGEDYYGTKLVPKSAKHGYYFWYDYTNKTVVVGTVEDIAELAAQTPGAATMSAVPMIGGGETFSPSSLRSDLIEGYYLMGCKGGELVDLIAKFENLGNDAIVGSNSGDLGQQYEFAVNEMLKFVGENPADGSLEKALLTKVQTTTIVIGEGAFRCNDPENIEHVYVPLSATIINVQDVFIYDNEKGIVDDNDTDPSSNPLATHAKVPVVQIPVGVKIASNGFPAMATSSAADGSYDGATILHILAKDLSELTDAEGNFMFDVQTCEPVFMLNNGAKYVMREDKVYTLPYNEGDTAVDIGGTVGTGTLENLEVKVEFPNASANAGEGTHYYDETDNILYVQYNLSDVAISGNNVSRVTWSYNLVSATAEATDLIKIEDGKLKINNKITLTDNNQILVTGKINDVEKVSFTVCLIMPRGFTAGSYNSTDDGVGVTGAETIQLDYDGNKVLMFNFGVTYNPNGKVAPFEITPASENGNFTAALNAAKTELTITLNEGNYSFEDALKVTIGGETFKIKVKATDKSGVAFEKAPVRTGSSEKVGDNYLFRVGNKNAITLNKLFTTTQAYSEVVVKFYDYSTSGHPVIGGAVAHNQTVSVSGATKADDGIHWTTSRDGWQNVAMTFAKTGVVKIEIGRMVNGEFEADLDVLLEVVEGTNITSYSQLSSSGNQVLWADITMTSGGTYALSGGTLFGNGYTFDVKQGAYAGVTYSSDSYVVKLTDATLNNVKLVGAVYTQNFGTTVKDDYHRAAVMVNGNSAIYNSYIANCMSAVRVSGGATLLVENSTLKGGSFANLDIRDGKVTLQDVTTINQVNGNDAAANGKVTVGLGIVAWYETVPETAKLTIKGTFKQYNYISKTQIASNTVENDYVDKFIDAYFGTDYCYEDSSGEEWVNTGIISMIEKFGESNVANTNSTVTYNHKNMSITVSMVTVKGHAWLFNTTESNYNSVPGDWIPKQYAIAPSYNFDYTTKNYVAKTDGSNDYCYESNGVVYISMDENETFNWDPYILTAKKGVNTLNYTVSMNGTSYASGSKIPFRTAGDYTVTYTYIDTNNYDKDGNAYDKSYTKTVEINVAVVKAAAKNAEFTFGSSNTAGKKVTIGNTTYVMPNVSATSATVGSKTISGTTVYYPIVDGYTSDGKYEHGRLSSWYMCFPVFKNVVTITDYADGGTGEAVTYGASTTTLPAGLAAKDPASTFQYGSEATAPTAPASVSGVLCYKSPTLSNNGRAAQTVVAEYTYQDNTGKTYVYYVGYKLQATTVGSCVTPDTLVTLADGTQKRIDELTYEDQLLVWDFYEGKYTTASASIIVNHGYDLHTVIKLSFDDGTVVKAVNAHAFFNADTNSWVNITEENAEAYVGNRFVKVNGDSYTTIELVDVSVSDEHTESWTITTADHFNCITEGVFSVTPLREGLKFFEVGSNMTYDAEQMQADIEKYGLYTYEEFAHLLTPEEFELLTIAEFKIGVGKGLCTHEDVLYAVELYRLLH